MQGPQDKISAPLCKPAVSYTCFYAKAARRSSAFVQRQVRRRRQPRGNMVTICHIRRKRAGSATRQQASGKSQPKCLQSSRGPTGARSILGDTTTCPPSARAGPSYHFSGPGDGRCAVRLQAARARFGAPLVRHALRGGRPWAHLAPSASRARRAWRETRRSGDTPNTTSCA